MRPGWNPTRCNRKIGTKAQGHGQENKLVIPESWHDWKVYWERFTSYVLVKRVIQDKEFVFFVEPTNKGHFHPCTIDDLCRVLSHCSKEALQSFDYIALRQPTKKQVILKPVWGRAIWLFELGEYAGKAIIIEAQKPSTYKFGKTTPVNVREIKRLKSDGHHIKQLRDKVTISTTASSVRNTALFRTLLHEIGHHIDYSNKTEEQWDNKSDAEKEDYAHRYADETALKMSKSGHIPFEPIVDTKSLEKDGLKLEWFVENAQTTQEADANSNLSETY